MIFVVAEIGVNWDGKVELVKKMMSKAKDAGCDAVKFQAFDEKIVKDHPQKSRLLKSSISKTNIETINQLAKSVGIEWFCTPMYPEAVEMLDPFVSKYKIRSAEGKLIVENKKPELFERVLKTEKEIIISSSKSPSNCKYFHYPDLSWLYCVPKYPCNFSDLNFKTLVDFDGYSNHCPHILAPLTATILGAKIIEVHITSDKSKNFIDNAVSFDYKNLMELVKLIRLSEKINK